MPKFIHADLIAQYAQDANETDEPWLRWQYKRALVNDEIDPLFENEWIDALGPIPFNPSYEYRRKPSKPRTININGYEVPEPVREPLECGQEYWLAEIPRSAPVAYQWCDDKYDYQWLAAGLIHLSEEAAQIHIDALLSFTRRDK